MVVSCLGVELNVGPGTNLRVVQADLELVILLPLATRLVYACTGMEPKTPKLGKHSTN